MTPLKPPPPPPPVPPPESKEGLGPVAILVIVAFVAGLVVGFMLGWAVLAENLGLI